MRNTKAQRFAQSYEKLGLETEVNTASPAKLIAILFAGAKAPVAKARLYLQANDIPNRGLCISKAIDIIRNGLRASLDESVGEVAKNMALCYELMVIHLLQANLKQDESRLILVEKMLTDMSEAWNIATGQVEAPQEL